MFNDVRVLLVANVSSEALISHVSLKQIISNKAIVKLIIYQKGLTRVIWGLQGEVQSHYPSSNYLILFYIN